MIVNHLSTSTRGGGASAARRLHEALRAEGIDSRFWCRRSDPSAVEDPTIHPAQWQSRPYHPGTLVRGILTPVRRAWRRWRLKSALAGRPAMSNAFSLPRMPWPTPLDPQRMGDGVLHLHGVANLIDYPSFFASLPAGLPIVWTLHDMFPFTGGCHYAGDCDAYLTQCRYCPQLGKPGEKDLANVSFHVKRRALRGKNLHVVAPSQWLTREAKRSRLLANVRSVRTIPYPLDTQRFQAEDRAEARRAWDLPSDVPVIAFGDDWLDVPRKGLLQFLECLRRLEDGDRVHVVLFGKGRVPRDVSVPPHLRHVGEINDAHRRARLYSAADIFVVASLQDNLPLAGLEAMACGTPVVGFAAAGVADFVRPQQTGLLAEVGNAADLARQIHWLLEHPQDGRRMGHNARSMIEREFAEPIVVAQYAELYRQLVDELHAAGTADRRAA